MCRCIILIYSICIICCVQAEIGIIYSPILGDLYSARVGQGAFCNGTKLKVTDVDGIPVIDYCTNFF